MGQAQKMQGQSSLRLWSSERQVLLHGDRSDGTCGKRECGWTVIHASSLRPCNSVLACQSQMFFPPEEVYSWDFFSKLHFGIFCVLNLELNLAFSNDGRPIWPSHWLADGGFADLDQREDTVFKSLSNMRASAQRKATKHVYIYIYIAYLCPCFYVIRNKLHVIVHVLTRTCFRCLANLT